LADSPLADAPRFAGDLLDVLEDAYKIKIPGS
jgi:hypothetical protein